MNYIVKSKAYSLDSLVSLIFLLSVFQAVCVNIIDFKLYITPVLLILLIVNAYYGERQLSRDVLLPSFLSIWMVLLSVLVFLNGDGDFTQEFIYQIFAILSFLAFVLFFSKNYANHEVDNAFRKTKLVVLIYLLTSLFIHFFYWADVAQVFYQKQNDFGGLLMDGKFYRMYGLLFNPLASAFSAFLLMVILYVFNCSDKLLYAMLFSIMVLSISRSAILISVFWMGFVFVAKYRMKAIFVLSLFVFLCVLLYWDFVSIFINSNVISDDTGSIREHFYNYEIGLGYLGSFFGEGYIDARQVGAWNVRLESMPLQYALTSGGAAFYPLILVWIISFWKVAKKYGFVKGGSLVFIVPLLISFPFHSFNLPVILFSMLVASWAIEYKQHSAARKLRY